MKQVTFDNLNEHVVKLVYFHIEKLQSIATAATNIFPKVFDHIKMEVSMVNDARIVEYKPKHVKSYMNLFTIDIAKKLKISLKEECFSLSYDVIYTIFLEVASFHANYISFFLNLK